jgi:hypothetical protein
MEYRVELFGATLPAAAALDAMLAAEDAGAVSDLDPAGRAWRVNTVLGAGELRELLARAGCHVEASQVRALPSVCCGGCSG